MLKSLFSINLVKIGIYQSKLSQIVSFFVLPSGRSNLSQSLLKVILGDAFNIRVNVKQYEFNCLVKLTNQFLSQSLDYGVSLSPLTILASTWQEFSQLWVLFQNRLKKLFCLCRSAESRYYTLTLNKDRLVLFWHVIRRGFIVVKSF